MPSRSGEERLDHRLQRRRGPDTATAWPSSQGTTLKAGVYASPTLRLTGTLTLDAEGNPNAVFIFQAGSTLITAPNSWVVPTNGASACNVYWQIGSSATSTRPPASRAHPGPDLHRPEPARRRWRALARNGVTLDNNVTRCGVLGVTPTPSPTAAPTPSAAHRSSDRRDIGRSHRLPRSPSHPTAGPAARRRTPLVLAALAVTAIAVLLLPPRRASAGQDVASLTGS
jgi:hypothetical protein